MYIINIKKAVSDQENGQDKLNYFISTWNLTFPDFFQRWKFSLTQNKISWLISGLEVIHFSLNFPAFDSHALYYHARNETLFLFCIASC